MRVLTKRYQTAWHRPQTAARSCRPAAKYSHARATGARVRAVAAWRYPTTYGIAPDWSRMDFEAWATQQLETSVAATLGDSPDIPVEISAVEGQPAPVLLDAA